jgi:hypothetical protein
MIILLSVIFILVALLIFFNIPYSKTQSEFQRLRNLYTSQTTDKDEIITEASIKNLPAPVQKYFRYCGYLGTPMRSYMKAEFKNVNFNIIQKGKPSALRINYTQYNFSDIPERFAYIGSKIKGIPFEGLDSYENGIGSMKGVIAKVIPLFDERGAAMDKACLVTFLADGMLFPNTLLKDYISWESIDDTHAKAVISYYGIFASGIFTFDDNGVIVSFKTSDRASIDMDGTTRFSEWSALCSDYKETGGILHPTVLKAVWHYPEGDFTYFDGNNVSIEYR